MTYLQIVVGLALLLAGGEYLVKGSVAVAKNLGVSPLLIGLTLVGFGTSMPELVASLNAALIGSPGIAVGNVVGSNIANILLILGVAALILPIATTREAFQRDGTVLIGVSLLLVAGVLVETVERWMGFVGLGLLAAYTYYTYRTERLGKDPAAAKLHEEEAAEFESEGMSTRRGLLIAAAAMAAVVLGANQLIAGSVTIARLYGVSDAVIGLTLVAIGTSLPELITAIMAALRRHTDIAFGNIIGSNIFNVLGILGTTAVVTPLAVPPQIVLFDVWVMLASAGLLVTFAMTGWRLNRWEGAAFLGAYLLYVAVQVSPAGRALVGID